MLKIRPVIVVGIGPQARRTVRAFVRTLQTRRKSTQAVLPVVLEYATRDQAFRRQDHDVQVVTLSPPLFDHKSWPSWLPAELQSMTPVQRDRTRAWLRASLFQGADGLQEFFLESIPRLRSFSAVESLRASGVGLSSDSQIDVYVIADLGDVLGSGIAVDVSCLLSFVCRQVGLTPMVHGVLYLPSATSPAPVEEAMAYAALKEIEYYARGNPYEGDFAEPVLTHELVPFADGCTLLDSVNEAGYTLHDEEQQVRVASEWLYAMTFMDAASALHTHEDRRYRSSTLLGKARSFQSMGLAVRTIPREPLEAWCAARLGQRMVERIVHGEDEGDAEKRLLAFVEHLGLHLEVIEGHMRRAGQAGDVDQILDSIRRASLGQIEFRARQALQEMRDRHLPLLDEGIRETVDRMSQEVKEAVAQEVRFTLQDAPVGGIVSAYRFLDLLSDHVRELADEVRLLSRRHQADLSSSLSTVSETYYALRKATMSIPPWPVILLAVAALLVLPVIYGAQWIWGMLRPIGLGWAVGTLVVMGLGLLLVLALVFLRMAWQRRHAIDMHVRQVSERFELESKPLVYRAVRSICEAAQEAIDQQKADLDNLAEKLRLAAGHMQEREQELALELRELASPDPLCSAVTLDRAEWLAGQIAADLDPTVDELVAESGHLADWQARALRDGHLAVGWLDDQFSRFGVRYAARGLRAFGVVDVLLQGSSTSETQGALSSLVEYAYPLWNYDPLQLRRGKTQRMLLVGLDASGMGGAAQARLLAHLPALADLPEIVSLDTGEPHTLVLLHVHRGVPLFALRRIGEYRNHYAQMLWQSRLPTHSANDLALIEDLIPLHRRPRMSTAALFATGLASGIVTRDAEGRYLAPRPKGRSIRLGMQKERSVALLAMDGSACRELGRQLEEWGKQRGAKGAQQAMEAYMDTAPDLENWEVKSILDLWRGRA